jgi:hypothetical protein
MVWEETPGWNYVGDAAFANYVDLYAQTRQTADELDGIRPTTGAMDIYSTTDWAQDVFGYDDYHSSDGAPPCSRRCRACPT